MSSHEIIKTIVEAFDKSDAETILDHMADDVEWVMLGHETLSGKETIKKFFEDHPDMKVLSITKDHFVVEGDTGIVDGQVVCTDKSSIEYDMYYCDIYDLKNSKLKKMTTYTINRNKK